MTRIFLVRHGETELNRQGVLQGRQDAPLTEGGVGHALSVGRRLSEAGLRRPTIWASPLRRALATAEIMLEAAGVRASIRTDDRLTEVAGGSFEGLTRDEAVSRAPGALRSDVLLLLAPDAEPYEAAADRLSSWLKGAEAEGGDHVVVSHAGAGRILRALYLGLGRGALPGMEAPHDTVFLLQGGEAAPL